MLPTESKAVLKPPELLQFFCTIHKHLISAESQAAGRLDIVKQNLTLAVLTFNLQKTG